MLFSEQENISLLEGPGEGRLDPFTPWNRSLSELNRRTCGILKCQLENLRENVSSTCADKETKTQREGTQEQNRDYGGDRDVFAFRSLVFSFSKPGQHSQWPLAEVLRTAQNVCGL